jgi:hypothetical protein
MEVHIPTDNMYEDDIEIFLGDTCHENVYTEMTQEYVEILSFVSK